MAMIANDDLILFSILVLSLVYLWDTLNRSPFGTGTVSSDWPVVVDNEPKTISKSVSVSKAHSDSTPAAKSKQASSNSHSKLQNGSVVGGDSSVISSPSTPIPQSSTSSSRSVVLPYLPGCEPDGPAAKEMIVKYPNTSIEDIVRYLVARKGNVQAASEMLEKCVAWRAANFPLKRENLNDVYKSKVMFYHGTARDGTPVIYFRGGLYDKNLASAETHVLGAAHCIDEALSRANTINVTVLVYTATVEGGPNAPADMNFIKAFVAVLSDNYPERLKRLILYPFPWWGRTIWSMVSMFLDKRTQEKVVLLSGGQNATDPPPKELFDYVDPREIPVCCGGTDKSAMVDMGDSLTM